MTTYANNRYDPGNEVDKSIGSLTRSRRFLPAWFNRREEQDNVFQFMQEFIARVEEMYEDLDVEEGLVFDLYKTRNENPLAD